MKKWFEVEYRIGKGIDHDIILEKTKADVESLLMEKHGDSLDILEVREAAL